MYAYQIDQVTKIYPRQISAANHNISLRIEQGEIFGILGDNGAGKTTLVKQMVHLLTPTSGCIKLFGRDISADSMVVPLHVGYMPQIANALNQLTVGEAIYFSAHLRGFSRRDARKERDDILEMWEIGSLVDKFSSRLSGGENRLVRLAVAAAGRLPILILDEPTHNLAPQRRRLVWRNLMMLNREMGTTVIFITHDAIEAEKVIQRLAILNHGELVAVGRPRELKQNIDQKLRLEMFCDPGIHPILPAKLSYHQLQPGRWIAWIDKAELAQTLLQTNLDQFDDFRIYSVTLEDLYVHFTKK